MKEVIYVNMKDITIGYAIKMHEDGYEMLALENGGAIFTKGGLA